MPRQESRASGFPPPSSPRRPRPLPKPVAELVATGLAVLPARFKRKEPALEKWAAYIKRKPTETELQKWFPPGQHTNYFVVTGSVSGVAVLDIDTASAEAEWREKLGSLLEETTASTTGKGVHYWFRIPEGEKVASRSGEGWDFRAEGTGVVAPPSTHPNGKKYAWLRGLENLQPLPDELGSIEGTSRASAGATGRSQLSILLNSPATEGSRNDWLTRVAGHYAKLFHDKQDSYEFHVRQAADLLKPPLKEAEIKKILDSVWKGEHERHKDRIEGSETGWLRSHNGRLVAESYKGELYAFGDFDVEVRGFAEGAGWLVNLVNGRGEHPATLTPLVLADRRKLDVLLGGFGLSLGPGADLPGYGRIGARLIRFMQSQDPPTIRSMQAYDYDRALGGFVTDDGVITPGATAALPAPVIVTARAHDWRYGFSSPKEARAVLREVLSWHDETVAAVFGSWWAACFVKFWIDEVSSQFPIMALHAPSESGKSTGFFPAMLRLNGASAGGRDSTRAALRDALSASRAGIVWVDDSGHPEDFRDLIRQVTAGGSLVKKSAELEQEAAKLVGPLLISGESVGIGSEKALLDRTIFVKVPSPRERRTPDGKLQWERIVEFNRANPSLNDHAGTLLAMAMEYEEVVTQLPSLRKGEGRAADKSAVLRVGATILQELYGSGSDWIEERLETWLEETESGAPATNENKLTLEHLPRALVFTGTAFGPKEANGNEPPTPAFVRDGDVWFNRRFLAEWIRRTSVRSDDRLDSEEAILQQSHELGIMGPSDRRNFKLIGGGGSQAQYYRIQGPMAEAIIARSSRVAPGPLTGGKRLFSPAGGASNPISPISNRTRPVRPAKVQPR